MENRSVMPKTNYYSFGLSASREQMNKVYNPMENSPRDKESRNMPGPGEYKYNNFDVGREARQFSFLRRTKNSQGKSLLCELLYKNKVCKILTFKKPVRLLVSIIDVKRNSNNRTLRTQKINRRETCNVFLDFHLMQRLSLM